MKKKSNSRQKLFKAALATAVLTGTMVTVAPMQLEAAKPTISDITNNQHREAITNLLERGIVNGFPDGTFKPNQQVTRGQAAKIIAQILNVDTKNVKDPGFKDVTMENQYYSAIAALVNAGIITGYEDKTFKPGNPLTRAQMAKILSLAFNFQEEVHTDKRFVDVKETNWYAGFVQTLLTHKITNGTSATTFSPGEFVTRGQLASFVVRSEKVASQGDNEFPTTPDEQLPKDEETKPVTDPNQPNENIDTDNPSQPGGNGEQNGTSPNDPQKDKDTKLTQAEIERNYASKLAEIEGQANNSLDSLIDSAMNEYNTMNENGEKVDITSLYNKYSGAANGLEAKTDASFNSVLNAMEADLAQNGYSTESIKGISENYNAAKTNLRNSLLSKLMEH